ncbi:molecular chaperone HscA [Buchnera aphidicola (Diuraphis noxia)]|uniref:Chaperone protein HscA n=1 Tax=Buchnera aphidicola subsp. Diuraphis noxia TaxID=118101 RepID=A0A1B2H977_BUCDN|nr:molecular chaperone HscA [Buchnera aphidicola (Diuraphis noxia)]
MTDLINTCKKKIFLGIDLGTTYSLVATVTKRGVFLLSDKKKRYLLPSIVHYQKNSVTVGWNALKKIIKDPKNTIFSVKRLLGRSIEFIKQEYPSLPYSITKDDRGGILLHTTSRIVTPIDVSSEILKYLKNRAMFFFEKEIDASVITVPAYFNNFQREATKKAANLANISLIRLLNEPTAAALAYGLEIKKRGIVIVYDLGGGTFDISVLKLNKGIFEVLATSGDSNLGGDDFDFELAKYIYKKSNLFNRCNNWFQTSLLKIARDAKLQLSQYNKVKVQFLNWTDYITRDEFNSTIVNLIEKTLLICSDVLKEIDLSIHEVQEIIMVGGSTRIPLVYQKVADFFKKMPLNSINPDKVVAMGAAIHANMLVNTHMKKKTLLLDVIPLSLGIEVMGGFVEKIILKNSTIPISKTKVFTTYKDNQTSILIHVLQGESEFLQDCISLCRFVLKNIKPQKLGLARILVTFQIDTDGLINIRVSEKNSNQDRLVQIDNNIILQKINLSKTEHQ